MNRSSAKRETGVGALLRRAFVALSFVALIGVAFAPLIAAAAAIAAPPAVGDVAADLRASFGEAFQLCVNDDGSQPLAPRHGDRGCPLCCLHGAAALAPPEAVALPAQPFVATALVLPPEIPFARPPARASPAQPRAPPRV